MIIPDIFRLNDWQIRRSSQLLLSLLVAFDVIFLVDKFIFELPILPQLFGFVVLTFIPGFIILRILKIHDLDRTTNFLLTVGLSLSFIMIFGMLINALFSHIGISNPISSFSLFYSFNIAIATLVAIAYLRDKDFSSSQDILDLRCPPLMLSLLLLPFLSIFGAYTMTFYDSNLLVLLLLFLLSLVPIIVAFNKIPANFYPLVIFVVSLSILYHVNLISMHIWSFDIFFEFYSANLVAETGIWNPTLDYGAHSLLLITILAPAYSLLCDLSLIWVFKLIFPFLFALTPLALYQVYQRLNFGGYTFDPKSSLLAVFIFVFYYGFFKDMPDKQHIAELFFALILLLMVKKIPNRVVVALIFSFALITSHYGVSYMFMLALIFSLVTVYIWKNEEENSLVTSNYVLFFSILALAWYMYVASGTAFESIPKIGYHVLSSISEILQPDARSGVTYVLYESQSTLWLVYKIIHIAVQVLIAIGIITLLVPFLSKKIRNIEITSFIIAFYALLVFQITTTYGMGFDRVLQITLVLLSPLALIGCISVINFLARVRKNLTSSVSVSQKTFAIILVFFFLFNSGFVFEVTEDVVPSYSIALNRKVWDGWHVFNHSEVCSAVWIKERSPNDKVSSLATTMGKDGMIISEYYRHGEDFAYFHAKTTYLDPGICVYLGRSIPKKGIPCFVDSEIKYMNYNESAFYKEILMKSYKVFDTGETCVYYVP
ncbi:MAG: DUF2206 domain-containing protein [Methanomicrobia archaeon]|nr:DUF2206 domain-containing protein [Methanomicrobia archaeon]